MSKRITPFASQNTVAFTLAADLCSLNFLVKVEDQCFQVTESRFVSGVFRWTQVSSPVIRLSNRLFLPESLHQAPHQHASHPHLHCFVVIAAESVVKFQRFEACDPRLTFLEPILQTPSDIPKCHGLFHEPYPLEFRVSKQSCVSSSHCPTDPDLQNAILYLGPCLI
ncbi:hypothetical protein ElyMa_000726600 [Elysia marginata]|uniref:Uncharacterized protein n=1 Tax=Elysia marginata TaxID=1093978 RepID=A0AAV4GMB9_9GAST|nr:hypothetical protein ElyMa_000726600 [Elysia marginata]